MSNTSEKSLCLPCSRRIVGRRKKSFIQNPKLPYTRQYGIFVVNFVAPKSTDNFQLGNHFLEAMGSTEEDEREMRGIIDDGVLKAGW